MFTHLYLFTYIFKPPLCLLHVFPLCFSCVVEKTYLLDVFTKLYIATDSNPVDGHTYELCSDLVDAVIDVSCIYGLSPQDGAAIPYDQESSSAIHLNSGMVLYLREVSDERCSVFLFRCTAVELDCTFVLLHGSSLHVVCFFAW